MSLNFDNHITQDFSKKDKMGYPQTPCVIKNMRKFTLAAGSHLC